MSIWSIKRQFTYASLFFVVVFGLLAILFKPLYTKAPTCADQKMNGSETGIDCGGSCMLMCVSDTVPPLVLWARSYPVTDSVWNAVAYIENQNSASYGFNALYEFRVYDKDNLLIAKTEGRTFINPNGRQGIFSPGIHVGNRIPKRTVFSFTQEPIWYKSLVSMSDISLFVGDIRLGGTKDKPAITAIIKNRSSLNMPKFEVFAFVYDENNNARTVSKTVVDGLKKDQEALISFTWNSSFGEGILRYSIEPVVDTGMILYAPK